MIQPIVAALPASTLNVQRRSGLSRFEFVRDYRNPGRPVILTDATKSWSALQQFSFDFFRDRFGERQVAIQGKVWRLAEVIDRLLSSTPEAPAPYPCKLDLRTDFAELASFVSPRPAIALPDRTHSPLIMKKVLEGLSDLEIFLGGPGGEFPYLHYDFLGLYAYINQIVGQKEFTILPPDQQRWVYPHPEHRWMSQIENHHQPDLAKYPLFAHATPVKVVLAPGETLFIPCGYWHTARSLTPSISVAFDQLCASNWGFFVDECCWVRRNHPLKLAVVRNTLRFAGLCHSLLETLTAVDRR